MNLRTLPSERSGSSNIQGSLISRWKEYSSQWNFQRPKTSSKSMGPSTVGTVHKDRLKRGATLDNHERFHRGDGI